MGRLISATPADKFTAVFSGVTTGAFRDEKIMLVLSRKVGERLWIGENISITVVKITGGGVRIGITAPDELPVVREELKVRMEQQQRDEDSAASRH